MNNFQLNRIFDEIAKMSLEELKEKHQILSPIAWDKTMRGHTDNYECVACDLYARTIKELEDVEEIPSWEDYNREHKKEYGSYTTRERYLSHKEYVNERNGNVDIAISKVKRNYLKQLSNKE